MREVGSGQSVVDTRWLRSILFLFAGTALAACHPADESSRAKQPAASQAAKPVIQHDRPPPPVKRDFDPAQITRGKAIFDAHCASCHGPNGRGQAGDWRVRGPDGRYPPPPLDDSAHAWHHPTRVLHGAIRSGIPDTHMPGWGNKLSDDQIDDVIVYIKSLWSDEVYAIWRDIERRSQENLRGSDGAPTRR